MTACTTLERQMRQKLQTNVNCTNVKVKTDSSNLSTLAGAFILRVVSTQRNAPIFVSFALQCEKNTGTC